MKVKELKKILNNLSKEDLELDVRVFADHGQHAMPCHTTGIEYIEDNSYMAELIAEEYINETSVKVFLISD